ncbi:MAG: hypothetical protein GVY14_04125 [Spirochaetes bacterium]|nr:hypothetical protein [Spirochaetota bacterium]
MTRSKAVAPCDLTGVGILARRMGQRVQALVMPLEGVALEGNRGVENPDHRPVQSRGQADALECVVDDAG